MLGRTDPTELAAHLLRCKVVDLSHTLEEGIPAWPTHARFGWTIYEDYALGNVARHYGTTMSEHTGTHMDAPLHFIQSGPAHYGSDQIPLDRLVGRAVTIETTSLEAGGLLEVETLRAWEENGPIEAGDRVLFRYGSDTRWATGPEGRSFLEDWPVLSREVAGYLVEKGISLVGCDTIAVDAAGSRENPAHHILLGNEVYIVENLKNLDRLPPFSLFVALTPQRQVSSRSRHLFYHRSRTRGGRPNRSRLYSGSGVSVHVHRCAISLLSDIHPCNCGWSKCAT